MRSFALASAILLVLILGFCFIGPRIYRTDQVHTNINQVTLPPSAEHPLGTDDVGYDVLGRLMVGGQTSLEVALGAAAVKRMVNAGSDMSVGDAHALNDALRRPLEGTSDYEEGIQAFFAKREPQYRGR